MPGQGCRAMTPEQEQEVREQAAETYSAADTRTLVSTFLNAVAGVEFYTQLFGPGVSMPEDDVVRFKVLVTEVGKRPEGIHFH